MDGTLTKPVIDFKLMRSRVGVPDGKDILDFISTQSVEQQALSHAAIKDVEAQVGDINMNMTYNPVVCLEPIAS